eukprot:m51a1_g483 hypothetical protein (147) ;mRNA; r:218200-218732
MASKLSLLLLLAATALASDSRVGLIVHPAPGRQSISPYTSEGARITLYLNNWALKPRISGADIECFATFTYLDAFGQPWLYPVNIHSFSCNTGRIGPQACTEWDLTIPAPHNTTKVIEVAPYCTYHGQRFWAEGTGNIKFEYSASH